MRVHRGLLPAVVSLIVLTGCASPDPELVASVTGRVEQGPTCPVETLDSPCPPAPAVGARVEVLQQGEVVASTTTDVDGRFELGAPIGVVEVRAESVDGIPSQESETFTLEAGDDVEAVFLLDTGIR